MTLPVINQPTFQIELPSTKKKVTVRPFTVREEKILLTAKQTQEPNDIMRAVKQIVQNCLTDGTDVNDIALFDLELLYIRIRSVSVSNIVELSYQDNEDTKTYKFKVDLQEVNVTYPEGHTNKIVIDDKTGLLMKYPCAALYDDKEFLDTSDEDTLFELLVRCIDKVYQGDQVFDAKEYTFKQLGDFLDRLDSKIFEDLKEFLATQPRLHHELTYKNEGGNDRKIELRTLTDFFTFR